MRSFDVVVVGAGHAGCEAAAAAARMGAVVALVTLDRQTVAEMPCNPAVGGIGKGHLVVEIDALGGLQGWASDRAGIQFRLLNASRGPAVWGPRAQCDKALYRAFMGRAVSRLDHLQVVEAEVEGLVVGDDAVEGVRLAGGGRLRARSVILTTGTFLGGVLHTGLEQVAGGRFGERPSVGLGSELEGLGLELRRFKTGTPPRLRRDSLSYERMTAQEGDPQPRPFSWRSRAVHNRCRCWLTRTPDRVQTIIEDNLSRSPLYSGRISGVGPRYCPSIEDKVVRFPHHREHTVFVEPEGLRSQSMYVNGLSTSLPRDVQEAVVRAVPGLEEAEFLRYGYAVEYDVVAPNQVTMALTVRGVPGLLLAGQLLGTSGYEEAAAQGLWAGVNAVLWLRGEEEFVVDRSDGYIGVLVDDLVHGEHEEPYRMFTSRAEHRLLLGIDSARERLMARGVAMGLVPERAFHVQQRRWERRRKARAALGSERLNPDASTRELVNTVAGISLRAPATWAQVLQRQDVDAAQVAAAIPALSGLDDEDRRVVVAQLRYEGYLVRLQRERERTQRLRHVAIPQELDLESIPGLSREVVERLQCERPRTIADVERLPGVTPAAVALIAGRVAAHTRARRV